MGLIIKEQTNCEISWIYLLSRAVYNYIKKTQNISKRYVLQFHFIRSRTHLQAYKPCEFVMNIPLSLLLDRFLGNLKNRSDIAKGLPYLYV